MINPVEFWLGLTALVLGAVALVLLFVRWIRSSRDAPWVLITKWVVTGLVIVFMVLVLVPNLYRSIITAMFVVSLVAACGMVLAVLWTPNVVDWISQKFESLYTGGDATLEAQAYYSVAEAQRKRGQYAEAVETIMAQLEKFPRDVTGHFLLAEIQAKDLHDLEAARQTVERFCAQPGHAAENIWLALNSLADWHLDLGRDISGAQLALERIMELLPETNQAQRAGQRLAHLADPQGFLAARDRTPIRLHKGEARVGLMQDSASLKPAEKDPEKEAADLALHLEDYPLDQEARERLALLYATHYRDMALAAEQLEMVIGHPQQSRKNQVRLLNLLADLQVQHGQPYESIRSTLERIIELAPQAASASQARQRLDLVRLSLKGREKSRVIPLGRDHENGHGQQG